MLHISNYNLKQYSFFSGLSDGALEALEKKIEQVELPAGTEIIREGAPADFFYIICRGEVEITKMTEFGQTARLSSAGAGETFGETAMITNLPRSSTVTARTNVVLSRISKRDFDEIVNLDSAFRNALQKQAQNYLEFNSLKMLQPFALVDPEKMLALIASMKERKYAPGEIIIRQGDKTFDYYIIKSGKVSVIKKEKDGTTHEVATLKSGAGFGEEAIIREQGRNATVQCLAETVVLILDKATFDGILRTSFVENAFPEDISEKERKHVVIIDARIPPEYHEEHIKDAINIPIEVLREKYSELDPSKRYYTYCTNDSRGMTAAFLMKSQGFDVKALRGGLSAWEGPTTRGGDGIHTPAH